MKFVKGSTPANKGVKKPPGNIPKPKIDASEKLGRVMAILDLIIKGERHADIARAGALQFGVTERQIHRYIKAAWQYLESSAIEDVTKRRALHINARMRLIKKAGDNVGMALDCWDSLAKIEGLVIRQMKIDHTTKGDKIPGATSVYKLPDGTELNI